MFADDIALYRVIKSQQITASCKMISILLFLLSLFVLTKCRTMLITRKRSRTCQPRPHYFTILAQVSSYKYLGITITSDLSWSPLISQIYNKVRKLIGVLYRHFYKHSNPHTLLKLVYLSYVRPHLNIYHMYGIHSHHSRVTSTSLKVCKSMPCGSAQSFGS